MTTISTPEGIHYARLAALKGAVRLESIGLKRRGVSARKVAIQTLGLKSTAKHDEVIAALKAKMDEILAEVDARRAAAA